MRDLLERVRSWDGFEDLGFVRLVGLRAKEEDLDLTLDVGLERREERPERWRVLLPEHERFSLEGGFASSIEVHEGQEHPLLWEITDSRAQLGFRGKPQNPLAVAGALQLAHAAATRGWIPSEKYLNPCLPLRQLIEGGFGILAEGPARLMQAYASAVRAEGVECNVFSERPPVRWRGGAWVPETRRLSALVFGDSFVIFAGAASATRVLEGE